MRNSVKYEKQARFCGFQVLLVDNKFFESNASKGQFFEGQILRKANSWNDKFFESLRF